MAAYERLEEVCPLCKESSSHEIDTSNGLQKLKCEHVICNRCFIAMKQLRGQKARCSMCESLLEMAAPRPVDEENSTSIHSPGRRDRSICGCINYIIHAIKLIGDLIVFAIKRRARTQ